MNDAIKNDDDATDDVQHFLLDEFQTSRDDVTLRRRWIKRIAESIVNDDETYLESAILAWLLRGNYNERDFYFKMLEPLFVTFTPTIGDIITRLPEVYVSDANFLLPVASIITTYGPYIKNDLPKLATTR